MAIAQFSGQYGHNMTLEVWSDWNRQDIASNSSTVNVQARLRTNGYASMWGVTAPVTVTVNGNSESLNVPVNIGTNSSFLFYGKDFTVPHNDDGTKTVGIQISVGLNTGGYGSSTVGFSLPLPTIPRASSVSDVTGTLGSAMTININRKVSSFTHTVKYDFGALNGTIATGVDTSVSWTPPLDLATAMPNKTSEWGNITVDTYSGSTKIGSATCKLTLNVPGSIKPTLDSITLTDTNAVVKNLLNTSNTFVQVLSNAQVTFNGASGAYGSTISSYRAEIVGKNQNTNSNNGLLGMMDFNGAVTIRATVTDSRGRTSEPVNVQATVLDYFTPQLSFTAQRSGSTSTTVTVTRNARIAPLTVGGSQKNRMRISFKYKEHSATDYTTDTGSASGTWTTISELVNSSANLGASFSVLQSYDLIGVISDNFTSYEYKISLGTEGYPLAIRPDRVGFGKTPEQAGVVDSAWKFYYNNNPIQHHQLTSDDGHSPCNDSGIIDLNTKTVNSFFTCNQPINGPIVGTGANEFYVAVYSESDGWLSQQAIQKGSGRMFTRTRNRWQWGAWIEYAPLNSVAEFTAVNQTKVYSQTIAMPFSNTATVTRIGNQVQLSWNRAISNINNQYQYDYVNETVPLGFRPASEAHMTLNGNAAKSVVGRFILHIEPDGKLLLTGDSTGNYVWTGTTTYLTSDPFPTD